LKNADGCSVAVFKPKEGEAFERGGLSSGMGAVREEAAYIVDAMSSVHAGIPVTVQTDSVIDEGSGQAVHGSLQAFHRDVVGAADDFGMPRDLEAAQLMVPQIEAQALAILDMRLFNTDRHGGNLLLLKKSKPHQLGPIDHGCCLPPWWCLGEACFDAWASWPQFQCKPSKVARDLAREAYESLPMISEQLRKIGLDEPSVITLRICTTFVYVGLHEFGLPIARLVELMVRSCDEPEELSWLEDKVLKCANEAGALISVQKNVRGDKELCVLDGGSGLQVAAFVSAFEDTLRQELHHFCDID
jgi:hypothetical protein